MIILNNAQTKKLEDYAVSRGGFDHTRLMENAGASVCRIINEILGSANKSVAVVCGIGNNGGDGFVVAKRLLEGGAKVRVLLALGTPTTDNAMKFLRESKAAGIKTFVYTNQSTAVMENLHQFAAAGCKMEGLCTITRQEDRWGEEEPYEVMGIRFSLN